MRSDPTGVTIVSGDEIHLGTAAIRVDIQTPPPPNEDRALELAGQPEPRRSKLTAAAQQTSELVLLGERPTNRRVPARSCEAMFLKMLGIRRA